MKNVALAALLLLVSDKFADVEITTFIHSSVQLEYAGKVIQVDPWSFADLSRAKPADLILITDDPGHHLDVRAIAKLRKPGAPVLIPGAGQKLLPDGIVIANGETKTVAGVRVEAIGSYDLTPGEPYHPKGEANGYIVTLGATRIYVVGVTQCVPEIRAVKNIDVAFFPLNLPLQRMEPDAAIECIRAIKPKVVYPYHYDQDWVTKVGRGEPRPAPTTKGIQELKTALGRDKIEVRLADWYPQAPGPGPRPGVDWPGFRGIAASGVDEGATLPVQWNVPESRLVKWRVPVAGLGHSSPIVWGDMVCTTSAVSGTPDPQLKVGLYGDITSVVDATAHKWLVVCFDKKTGALRWERTAKTGVPIVKRHPKSTHASSTLATDGQHIVAFFGSEGLYAYDVKGELIWKQDFGLLDSGFYMVPDAQWGFASSPVIHNGRVVVQADVQKGSFVAAFDVRTGRQLWRTSRGDVPTFSTPAVVPMNGRDQVIVNGWKHIGGYDLETGKEVWRMTGGGDIPVPTPIAAHGLVFITNAHGQASPIYAVKATATGDITLKAGETSSPHIAWSYMRDGGYMQTPIVYGDLLYVCRDNGVLSVFDAKTGVRHYQGRLGDGRTGFSASAVAAGGRVYFTSEDGDVYVVKAGTTFDLLATNPLGEVAMATPAISESTLLFRTRNHLVAVGDR